LTAVTSTMVAAVAVEPLTVAVTKRVSPFFTDAIPGAAAVTTVLLVTV
jgi:hypothetical protein